MPARRTTYAELAVTSNLSFLEGASHPEELVERAAALGLAGVALTDRGTLGGIVRAHVAAKALGFPLAVGARLALARDRADAAPLEVLVYATDRASYGRLCRLLTVGKRRAGKGGCDLALDDLLAAHEGLLAVALAPAAPDAAFLDALRRLHDAFDDDRLSLGAQSPLAGDDRGRVRRARALARDAGTPLVAVGDVAYHDAARRPLHDVLAAVRLGTTVAAAGFSLAPNAERRLHGVAEVAARFTDAPEALARTGEVLRRAAAFSLDALRYEYPDETGPPGVAPREHLRALVLAGAARRYPRGVPEKVRAQVEHELAVVADLRYEPYFLTVHELVDFARSRGILCQGRGAAANSAVCYCLGITALDPDRMDVLFERFVSRERAEPPDIDIDFEHERREEVIQHVYARWGRDRAALTAEVISYRGRSAVREVGKALGLSRDAVERLARAVDAWADDVDGDRLLVEAGLDPAEPSMRRLLALSKEVLGFPRHRSQHVGGFVVTRGPLCETVPLEDAAMPGRTVIEWDKDDIEALGILKVDVLGLGMLTCVRKAFAHVEGPRGDRALATVTQAGDAYGALAMHTVPPEDPAVYDMLCAADTVGVFQVESRAQMAMLPRLRPRTLYDLAIEVAIVRPGPIQGDMVHPYLRRRRGEEPVTYPSPDVEKVLGRTLGVPLFQEQAMALAIVAAGFTPGEADRLRRAMAAWKRKSREIEVLGRQLVEGMVARGYPREFADRCHRQIHGFSEYGFPESHAASFALIVYVSAWLKRHHPAAFAAALLDSQPMGFYAPAQIVRDARAHGVDVRPVDVNASGFDCRLEREPGRPPALRLGMRLVTGLSRTHGEAVAAARAAGAPFAALPEVRRRAGVPAAALRALAAADAFRSLGLARREALWQARALRDEVLPLFDAPADDGRPDAGAGATTADLALADEGRALPRASLPAEVVADYATTGLSLKAHPMSFPRAALAARGVVTAATLSDDERAPDGSRVAVAGLVLVRQRPVTAHGILFVTLEDETGIANLIVRPREQERFRAAARHAGVVLAVGTVERDGAVVHVLVRRLVAFTSLATDVDAPRREFR
ncbi:MAG: error-prone DNA polymerase [Planctomycetes bacterium]|nr:error-prone DNA polymerase [Planctomycetota bacterium]